MLFDCIIPYPTWEVFLPDYSFFCPECIFWIPHFRRNFRGTEQEFLEHVEDINTATILAFMPLEERIAARIVKLRKEL